MTTKESNEKKISYESKVILENGDIGIVKFVGLLSQKKDIYYGIDLIKGDGKNDGSIGKPKKIRYFKSKKKKSGRFVTIGKISKVTNNGGPCIFDEVVLKKNSKLQGTIKYIGIPVFSNATSVHYGIELTTPDGDCNGSKKSRKYFNCKSKYGLFAKGNEIILLSEFKKSLSKKRDSLTVQSLPVSSQSVKKLLKDRSETTTGNSNKQKKRISVTIPKDEMKKMLKDQSPKKSGNKKVTKPKSTRSNKSTKLTKPKKTTKLTSPKKSTKSTKPKTGNKKSIKSPKKSPTGVKSPKKSSTGVKSPKKSSTGVKSPKKPPFKVKSPKKVSKRSNNSKKSANVTPKKSNKKSGNRKKPKKSDKKQSLKKNQTKSGNKKLKNSKKEKTKNNSESEKEKISRFLLDNYEMKSNCYVDPVNICEKYLGFDNRETVMKDDLIMISKTQILVLKSIENNFEGITQSDEGFGLCAK